MKQRLIIIGAGMACARFVEELMAQQAACSEAMYKEVIVISSETKPCYNRILLSSVLAGEKSEKDLDLLNKEQLSTPNIEWISPDTVTSLDPKSKTLITYSGRMLTYDQLLFATGSRANIPNIPGAEHADVMGFRNLNDLEYMTQKIEAGVTRAVVIGGGLLGLEAAHGLNLLGAKVTVLHRRDWLMNRQIDRKAGKLLQQKMEQQGISFVMNASASSILKRGTLIRAVETSQQEKIPASLVVFAAGVLPNKELAEQAGIACEHGISIDHQMRTSVKDIYAIGECAQLDKQCFGLVAPCWEQAEILAENMIQNSALEFHYQEPPTQLKVSGIEVFSAGNFNGSEQSENLVLEHAETGLYRRLVIENNTLIGSVLIGNKKDSTWYSDLIRDGADITAIRPWLMFGQDFCEEQTC